MHRFLYVLARIACTQSISLHAAYCYICRT